MFVYDASFSPEIQDSYPTHCARSRTTQAYRALPAFYHHTYQIAFDEQSKTTHRPFRSIPLPNQSDNPASNLELPSIHTYEAIQVILYANIHAQVKKDQLRLILQYLSYQLSIASFNDRRLVVIHELTHLYLAASATNG